MSRLQVDPLRVREIVLVREDRVCPECGVKMHIRCSRTRNIHTLHGPVRLIVKLVQCRSEQCDNEDENQGRPPQRTVSKLEPDSESRDSRERPECTGVLGRKTADQECTDQNPEKQRTSRKNPPSQPCKFGPLKLNTHVFAVPETPTVSPPA